VPLPDRDVRDVGRNLVRSGRLADEVLGALAQAIKEWPALQAGLIESVSSLSVSQQQALFAGPAARLFRLKDFASHPMAAEEWLVQSVTSGRAAPAKAFEHVVKRRHDRGLVPAVDMDLLRRLWPNRDWTAREAAQIVVWLPPEDFRSVPVQEQLGAILSAIPDAWHDAESWRKVVLQLYEMPRGALQDPRIAAASTLAPSVALLDVAASQPANAEDAIGKLIKDYGKAGPEVRELLDLQLPPLLLWHPNLGAVLTTCPKALRDYFASYSFILLQAEPHDARAAARLYLAVRVLGQAKLGEYANVLEKGVLAEALTKWNRDELDEVTAQIEVISPKEAATFKLWKSKRLGRLGRRALW